MNASNMRQLLIAALAGLLIAAVAAVAVQPVLASVGPDAGIPVLGAVQMGAGPAANYR